VSANTPRPLRRTAALIALVTLLLTALKLTRVITWAWWQVLAPAWMAAGVALYVLSAVAVAWLYRR
jgi:hypothetical protein